MRRSRIIAGTLVGLGFASLALYAISPWLLEKHIELRCSLTEPSRPCLTRMRGMGHVWARWGNLARAGIWYGRAAEHDDTASMFHLAWTYHQRASDELLLAAGPAAVRDAVHDAVQSVFNESGNALWRSLDRPRAEALAASRSDGALAVAWYEKAAAKGFAPAMNNLGELYHAGISGFQDLALAYQWHRSAAEAGNPVGAWNVALDYAAGRGVVHDQAAVDRWSTWVPTGDNKADLIDPVLERTFLFGRPLPEPQLAYLRAAAKDDSPVKLTMAPLEPAPSLKTFSEVQRELGGTHR